MRLERVRRIFMNTWNYSFVRCVGKGGGAWQGSWFSVGDRVTGFLRWTCSKQEIGFCVLDT